MFNLNQLLNIEYPIIQGGMAHIATGAFAADVSNAGGLGIIGCGSWTVEKVKEEIDICRSKTDKPFGVNVMLMNPQSKEIAELLAEEKIAVITTGAGNPAPHIEMWKNAGAKVIPVIASVALARRVVQYGADGVIAEGTEAGGHIGDMTTMALMPQVVDAVDVPVICAGGIATGRQLLAAEILGAAGVQLGTLLLATDECPIHDNYKQAVLKAGDTDAVVTGRNGGAPVRVLKNQMTREYMKRERAGATKEELEIFTLGGLSRAVFEGDTKSGSMMAGQVAGLVNEQMSLRETFEKLFREYDEAKKVICNG